MTSIVTNTVELRGGGRLQWDTSGEGTPVVFLHGFTFDRRLWQPQVAALSAHLRCVRYDLRGFGGSSVPAGPYRHIDDLRALLSRANIVRPVLVGLSLGANVALPYAMEYPQDIAGLVLAAPGLPGYRWRAQRPPEAVAAYSMTHTVAETRQFWLDHPVFASTWRYPAARSLLRDMVRDYSGWHWRNADQQQPGPDIRASLGGLRVPTLVMSGDQDVEGYREIAAEIAATVPDARHVRYAAAGHVMNLEQPDAFNTHVLEFVRGLQS